MPPRPTLSTAGLHWPTRTVRSTCGACSPTSTFGSNLPPAAFADALSSSEPSLVVLIAPPAGPGDLQRVAGWLRAHRRLVAPSCSAAHQAVALRLHALELGFDDAIDLSSDPMEVVGRLSIAGRRVPGAGALPGRSDPGRRGRGARPAGPGDPPRRAPAVPPAKGAGAAGVPGPSIPAGPSPARSCSGTSGPASPATSGWSTSTSSGSGPRSSGTRPNPSTC